MSPTEVLLVGTIPGFATQDGQEQKICVNLWEAIEKGRLWVMMPRDFPIARLWVKDTTGDCPENREELNFVQLPLPW